ncbi:hypothetical protein Glove_23g67 [Diversispora epigaea]|uniref:Uncharacterized protein n=1 Tax=Diversispora epigaea TaxID=1348612 RepID=A0A397JL37_9GLOM|nr:hypothetical protein Glove_23g67 [Diversispora epigaea]
MDDIDNWFIVKDSFKYFENALRWKDCNSDSARKKFTKNSRILSSNDLNNIQKKINEFQVPADLGRISGKIYYGESFSNFTADQWRIFISIYSTVVLWEYLEECFLFERMNGILDSLSNSHQQNELELMRRLINDNRINEMIYTENNSKGLEIFNTQLTISEKEPFPGEMLKPFSENIPLSADGILDLMIAYYNDTYENLKFRKPFETDSLNSIIIPLKINKYCRYRIDSEIFGSTFSPRYQKSLYILAKFASEDDSIDIYPGQIQFFFVHEISTNRINMENHYLAYVLWYKKIKNQFYFSDTEFYLKSRDCIIPVHYILGQFVPVKYKISDRKNVKEYLAVNLINRKYNLH